MSKFIDKPFAVLIAALAVWWILVGQGTTPAEQIARLEKSTDPSVWTAALSSEDRTVRKYARENLIERLPEASLEPVALEAVRSSDEQMILAGLWILAKVDVDSRGEIAWDFLDSENNEIIEAALDVLALDPVADLHDRLVELSSTGRESTSDAALKALAALKNPDDLPIFLAGLGSPRMNTRDIASDAILGLAPVTPHLLSALTGVAYGNDLSAARESLRLIGELDDVNALETLFYYLEYGPIGLSSDAANAIANSGNPDAANRALDLFVNADGHIRNQAARVLGAIGNIDAQDYLWATVIDSSQEFWLRYYSMEALATCGTPELVPEVIEYIENVEPDDRIVRAGIESIGGMGGKDVFTVYDAVIDGQIDFGLNRSGGNQALLSVINGLGKMKSGESQTGAIERLRTLAGKMGSGDIENIMAVARALGNIGTRDEIEVLNSLEEITPVVHGVVGESILSIIERYPEPHPLTPSP